VIGESAIQNHAPAANALASNRARRKCYASCRRSRSGEAISPPAAIRIGGNAQAAKLVEKPQAVYPPEAMAARIQGIVHLNVVIGQDGRVENATLQSGHPLLVPAAVEAVGRYRYQPTLMNGTPIKVISQVDVPFTFSN
jgi:TonB family protein